MNSNRQCIRCPLLFASGWPGARTAAVSVIATALACLIGCGVQLGDDGTLSVSDENGEQTLNLDVNGLLDLTDLEGVIDLTSGGGFNFNINDGAGQGNEPTVAGEETTDPANPTTGDNGSPAADSGARVVTVIFANLTSGEGVDVEFHTSSQQLSAPRTDLFDNDASLFTTNLGIAGTGLIPPKTGDRITLPCSPSLTLGTAGGLFRDIESGEIRGQGQARWVQEGGLDLCGRTVTFTFARRIDGQAASFVTSVSLD